MRMTGLVLREPELRLVLLAYADDVLLVVQDPGNLARVEACQAIYSAASSARVNWVKSSGLAVGDWRQGRLTGLVLRELELRLVLSAYADDVLLVIQEPCDLARVEACQAIYLAASSALVNWVKSSGLAGALGLGLANSRNARMTESDVQRKLELATFEAEERQKEHERQMALKHLDLEAEERKQAKRLEVEEEAKRLEVEEEAKRLEKEMEAKCLEAELELKRFDLKRAKMGLPNNPNNPSPKIHKWEQLCPQYDESCDIAEYFITFERLYTLHAIPDDHKMTTLVAKLTGRALDIFNKMPIEDASDYGKFKDLVLKQFQITPETYRVKFRALKRRPGLSNVAYVNQMKDLLDKWVKGRGGTSFEGMCDLVIQEQFLTMTNDDIKQCFWDKKIDSAESLASYADQYEQSQTVREVGQIRTKWVEVAKRNNPGRSSGRYQKGHPETTPYYRGQPKAPITPQGKPQTPYHPTTPFSSNPPRHSDPSAGRCFKCNEPGHVKANCPKNPNRLQFIAPESHQRSTGPDTSDTLRAEGNCECGWEEGHRVEGLWSTSVSYPCFLSGPQFNRPRGPSDNSTIQVKQD
ncbi:unnamed protein product [Lepidochelys olivacea]